jgi:hypothetical protein
VPEAILRRLFEAFRLQVHYDKRTNIATCWITLTGETLPAVRHLADSDTVKPLRSAGNDTADSPADQATSVPICCVPPAGFEPATYRLGGGCSIP